MQPTEETPPAIPAQMETPAGKQTVDEILAQFYAGKEQEKPLNIITGRDENGTVYVRFSRAVPALAFRLEQAREFHRALGLEIANATRDLRAFNQAAQKAKGNKKKK